MREFIEVIFDMTMNFTFVTLIVLILFLVGVIS